MRGFGFVLANYVAFVIVTCLLAGMQASLWFHVFGFFPAPYLWLAVLNYWILYRSIYEAVIMSYLISFAVVTMSGVPLDMAFGMNLAVVGTIYLLRDRVLWSGPNSFMFSCGISAVVLPVATFILSHVIEESSVVDFHFYDWLVRPLLTAVFSLPLFYFFSMLDRLLRKEPPKNTESEVV
jgi:hypothetical protein